MGASGFLGGELSDFFKNKDKEVFGTCFFDEKQGLITVDLTKEGELKRIIDEIEPDIIINALNLGGFLDPNPKQTRRVNFGVNQELSRIFDKKIVAFSTDNVFDGKKGDYIETDEPNPLNNYGKTKQLGEKALLDSNKDVLVLRMCILYNDKIKGYVKFVYDSLKEGKEIEAWEDIIACPTHTEDVCLCLSGLLEENASGIYHVAGQEKMSRYEFALKIAEYFNLNKSLIKHPNYIGEIKRPKDTSLSSIKLGKKCREVEISVK